MKKAMLIPVTLLFMLGTGFMNLNAQPVKYTLSPESTMMISGTSTIHDWECNVKTLNLEAMINPSAVSETQPHESFIQSLSFSAPVESIDCGKKAMNNKTYDALKKDKYPDISFSFKNADRLDSASEDSVKLEVSGDLTIAGVTKTVSFTVVGQKTDSGFAFNGSYKLNMKDYKMDPPTAVFGTIRAGEMVGIKFNVILTTNQL